MGGNVHSEAQDGGISAKMPIHNQFRLFVLVKEVGNDKPPGEGWGDGKKNGQLHGRL
jgi:hypothetical protein